jgi:hypothetical protein
MACLRTETRRSASGKISPTSAFRVHKVVVDEIPVVGGEVKITPVIFGVMAESALVGGYKHFETCGQQFRDRRRTEDRGNKPLKKMFQPTTNYGVSQNTTTIS